ncbi:MAG: hypothetical protein H6558_12060 [Lewinellaceae bacterium]|nr:hypothetical protein [Lewinellaceae bacterium]
MTEKLAQQYEALLEELRAFKKLNESINDLKEISGSSIKASQELLTDFVVRVDGFGQAFDFVLDSYKEAAQEIKEELSLQSRHIEKYEELYKKFKDGIDDVKTDLETVINKSKSLIEVFLSQQNKELGDFTTNLNENNRTLINENFNAFQTKLKDLESRVSKRTTDLSIGIQNLEAKITKSHNDITQAIQDIRANQKETTTNLVQLLTRQKEEFTEISSALDVRLQKFQKRQIVLLIIVTILTLAANCLIIYLLLQR